MTTLATQFQLDCALMAGAVYVFNRNAINQLPVPPGWTLGKYQSENTGFEAASFIDGSQIVISYAGTAPITLSIPAGQDRATFALVDTINQTVSLTNALSITFNNANQNADSGNLFIEAANDVEWKRVA